MLWLTSQVLAAPLVIFAGEAEIAADPAAVQEALLDFDAYAEWNPWLTSAVGEPLPGATVAATVRFDEGERVVRHRVLVVEPATFCWEDLGAFTVVARGQRCRELVEVPGGTEIHVELSVRGPLKGLVERRYGEELRRFSQAELEALKVYVEGG